MKPCRLPVAATCLLTVLFAAGWAGHTVQAAPLLLGVGLRPRRETAAGLTS